MALPKGSAQVGGVQGCRPISLYEVILKVATGIVHRKMQAIVARHHLLNDRQIFNVRNRGVHDALQLVLNALGRAIGRGKAVYVATREHRRSRGFPVCAASVSAVHFGWQGCHRAEDALL